MTTKLRAQQENTLKFFQKRAEHGATISEVRDHFKISHPSARSRVTHLQEKKLLKLKREKTPKNTPLLRFFMTAKAKKLLA